MSRLERARAEEGMRQAMFLGDLTLAIVARIRRALGAQSGQSRIANGRG